MKSNRTLMAALAALLILPVSGLFAQATAVQENVDYKEVVANYIEATGGEAAHKAIKSVIATGKMSIPEMGLEGDMSMKQSGEKVLVKVVMDGIGEQRIGSDGETVWEISEMTGAQIVEGERRDQMLRDFKASPYLNIDEQYDSIKCTGTEEFNGEKCYVLEAKRGDEEPEHHYFSVDSRLLVGKKMTQITQMGNMELVSKIGEYKKVGDISMSHSTSVELPQGMSMVTTLEKIDINPEIEDSLFELPKEIAELKQEK